MKILKIRTWLVLSLSLGISFLLMRLFFNWNIFEQKIDYSQLEYYLSNKQWQQADTQTAFIYNQLVLNYIRKEGYYGRFMFDFLGQREAQIYLQGELPCHQLTDVDQLWLKYSQGRFGFAVQAQILNSIDNHEHGHSVKQKDIYFQQVGWYQQRRLKFDNDFTSLDKPLGYLPSPLWTLYSQFRGAHVIFFT